MLRIIKKNLGIYFMIIASIEFSFVGASAKILSEEMSSIEIMFFRNIIGTFFMIYILKKIKFHKSGGHFGLLVFRGVIGTISLYLFFYNVSNISLGGAFAFQKTAPIFIALIAFFFFKEELSIRMCAGILIAFIGVLFVCQPFADEINHSGFDLKNSVLGILSGFCAALALTSVRELKKFYPAPFIALSFVLIGTLMPLSSMIVGSFYENKELDFLIAPFIMPSFKAWFFIILMGVFGALYQIHITKAYGVAKKVGVIAGIGYIDVVFTLFLGILLGDDFPSALVFVGIIGIVIGGIILVSKQTQGNKSGK
ncbi:DMT family transporter [Campylobacter insulaenigrae]|uniref:DMT family transporter n=1 Tax=Campylobacter insulaenigrae TaxID=260714 RepID=UPI0021532947|nr:DMT family transporter [Campylobacter insulaenigrae]MCR6570804.1 DMT family transporter [Campylobacter insulaenigrae]MCR6572539.1 DMT family transporter [Campylobacter insulaenigrae]MCR6573508.1 DMT family transporter [Campylobacter insulaenigrae]MCR6575290.1 DMT family transporter [Campylobacter insulaenigrae]MCR6578446.1 DMT family transporter [Campylobacter insulaenigrae]